MATKKTTTKISTKAAPVTKAPVQSTAPFTSLREFKSAVLKSLATDGKGAGELNNSWEFEHDRSVGRYYAKAPTGTRRSTLENLIKQPTLANAAAVGAKGNDKALYITAVAGGTTKPQYHHVADIKTARDLEISAKYHLITGNIGCSLEGWVFGLDAQRTSAIAMPPSRGVTEAHLHKLVDAEHLNTGHVDLEVTPPGGGRKRKAIVVGVPWTSPLQRRRNSAGIPGIIEVEGNQPTSPSKRTVTMKTLALAALCLFAALAPACAPQDADESTSIVAQYLDVDDDGCTKTKCVTARAPKAPPPVLSGSARELVKSAIQSIDEGEPDTARNTLQHLLDATATPPAAR